jgi:hypothetical protein
MTYVDWQLHGPELTGCNCDFGCPCQFNALPTRGDCRAAVAGEIERGYFGDVQLDGLRWAAMFDWPGAVHEGNGEALLVIDERADDAQRDAMLKILTGQETEPGATVFAVFASTFTKVHAPVFASIDFACDLEARRGSFSVPELVEVETSPIRNPVTGAEHSVKVVLPHGFEYLEAEYASSKVSATGPIELDWDQRHAHMAMLHLGPYGQVS